MNICFISASERRLVAYRAAFFLLKPSVNALGAIFVATFQRLDALASGEIFYANEA